MDYEYKISRDLVTVGQWTEFLNAVASTSDEHLLYRGYMGGGSDVGKLITRTKISDNNYEYTATPGLENVPIISVTWNNAARFVNWLHNGQGNGGTESGVYNLTQQGIPTASEDAIFWIPTEDEWYKAAYYDPDKVNADSTTGGYWLYPMRSDTPGGNVVEMPNSTNYYDSNYASNVNSGWNSRLSEVGLYGKNSQSAYGTNDQGGNVTEWNDAIIGTGRGLRGGAWSRNESPMRSSLRVSNGPESFSDSIGFRVAGIPEPSVTLLGALFAGVLTLRRRR